MLDGYYKNGRFYDSDGKVLSTVKIAPLEGVGIKINATNFPDDNFRAIVKSTNINKNGDNYLIDDEIKAVKVLVVSDKGIKDLTGIGFFTELTNLCCSSNKDLTSINLSNNTKLVDLNCDNTGLSSLILSNNTALTELSCSYTNLSTLDVSKNTELKSLLCNCNQKLKTLIVSNNSKLEMLQCYNLDRTGATMESLDVSKCTNLKFLHCGNKGIKSLDVSKNTKLMLLECPYNSLESLDVTKNTQLNHLDCAFNYLPSLTISADKNTALNVVICHGNLLTLLSVDDLIDNLPTVTEGLLRFCTNNSSRDNFITKTQVQAAAGKGWKVKRLENNNDWVDYAGEEYLVSIEESNFPDPYFRAIVKGTAINKNGDNYLSEDEIRAVTSLDVHDTKIQDMKGLEYFTALTELYCQDTQVTSLDVSRLTRLKRFHCPVKRLTSLDVSKLTELTELKCNFNSDLGSLDVSHNPELVELDCTDCGLTTLDLSNNKKLKVFSIMDNDISGAGLDQLINSLPIVYLGTMHFCRGEDTSSMTLNQYLAITKKHWDIRKLITFLGYQTYVPFYQGDVNCNGEINQADLDKLVEIIMSGIYDNNGDLDGNARVNALDVVIMVDILKGKK